jgi:hypothetical protein
VIGFARRGALVKSTPSSAHLFMARILTAPRR